MFKITRKRTLRAALLLALALAVTALAGCQMGESGGAAQETPNEDAIHIGCTMSLSNKDPDYQTNVIQPVKQALELAIKEINDAGGILDKQIVVDIQDTYKASDAKMAEIAERFKDYNAIIGGNDQLNASSIENKQIIISLSSTPDKLEYEASPYLFFASLRWNAPLKPIVDFMVEKASKKHNIHLF